MGYYDKIGVQNNDELALPGSAQSETAERVPSPRNRRKTSNKLSKTEPSGVEEQAKVAAENTAGLQRLEEQMYVQKGFTRGNQLAQLEEVATAAAYFQSSQGLTAERVKELHSALVDSTENFNPLSLLESFGVKLPNESQVDLDGLNKQFSDVLEMGKSVGEPQQQPQKRSRKKRN